jgi:hypothetical protein|uniref:Uncharacterized protein n=2 Tax=Candidatus Methanogaster sp. ANME-2c ERB4 TaxID=2759911 RepID=A0A7G9YAE3_9EURY|nr:hypothetical protein IKFMCCCA_00002 [Methanosarcinales archaeon ANME-2c ERB4]QNO45020.1 hypothetical protein DLDHEMGK_00004 [Methanosarcinales archaeon ANME-2c ERB4]
MAGAEAMKNAGGACPRVDRKFLFPLLIVEVFIIFWKHRTVSGKHNYQNGALLTCKAVYTINLCNQCPSLADKNFSHCLRAEQAAAKPLMPITLISSIQSFPGSVLIYHNSLSRFTQGVGAAYIPIISIIGFLGAGAMGFWLLYSILRHGRM